MERSRDERQAAQAVEITAASAASAAAFVALAAAVWFLAQFIGLRPTLETNWRFPVALDAVAALGLLIWLLRRARLHGL